MEYLTGGVGSDQSTAIQRVSKQWPLTLEFAVKDKARADFAADVKTVVRDAKLDAASGESSIQTNQNVEGGA